jgi:hypothetical protein
MDWTPHAWERPPSDPNACSPVAMDASVRGDVHACASASPNARLAPAPSSPPRPPAPACPSSASRAGDAEGDGVSGPATPPAQA